MMQSKSTNLSEIADHWYTGQTNHPEHLLVRSLMSNNYRTIYIIEMTQ